MKSEYSVINEINIKAKSPINKGFSIILRLHFSYTLVTLIIYFPP